MSEFQFLKIQFSFWLSELHHVVSKNKRLTKGSAREPKVVYFPRNTGVSPLT